MPEGPEIQRAADSLARILVGQRLNSVKVCVPALQGYESRWKGETVLSVTARGKALLTRFSNDDVLYSHNQLYGRWVTRRSDKEPSSNRSLRLAFFTEKGSAYLYSATDIEVLEPESLCEQPYLAKLGPDVLDKNTTVRTVSARLRAKAFRNRQLASLLLDQGFLAGPGNYLRSEILFCAGIHPRSKPSQLSSEALTVLSRCTLELSQRAYKQAGVTVEAELWKRLKAGGLRKRDYRHYVFAREGKPCRLCREAVIQRLNISSRSVFLCPRCQDA